MSAWDSWSARDTTFKPVLMQGVNYLHETEQHDTDTASHYARTRVRSEWSRTGVTEATAQWHAQTYRGDLVAARTAASAGYLLTNGAPVQGASYIDIDGLSANAEAGAWYKGWRFMVWGDPTIYTIAEDTQAVALTPTTICEAGNDHEANALGTPASTQYLYWADSDTKKIRRANPLVESGPNVEIITGGAAVRGIALDTVNGHIYFAETTKLRRCSIADGSGAAVLVTHAGSVLRGVALDATNSKLYYTSTASGVRRCDLDGSNDEELIAETDDDDFWDIKLDVTGNKIYFSDVGNGTVERATLAGADRTSILTGCTANIRYLALDVTNSHIYYCTATDPGYIYRAGISGTPSQIVLHTRASTGVRSGLAIDATAKKLYFGSSAGIQYAMPLQGISTARVKITPVITAAAAAAGDGARIHFFIPQDAGGAFYSHPKGYSINVSEEYVTPQARIYSPEP